jgi:CRP/FNR family transcriptional regulator, anaerobic regulatory protein
VIISPNIDVEHACIEPCSTCRARGLSVCRVLPTEQLRRLAGCLSVKRYAAGQSMLYEDDPADAFFNITQGAVKLFKLLPDGRRQIVGFLFAGDFLGLSARGSYGFGAEAVNAVEACRFPKRAFRELSQETPGLEEELLSRASDELQAAQSQMLLLGRKSARERVASFISELLEREEHRGGAPGLVFLPMTRADMGDYLGLTTETVSRAMSRLRRDRTIQLLEHGGVRVIDRDRLFAVANAVAA